MANLVSEITFYQQNMMRFFPKAIVMFFETVLQTKFYVVYIIPNLDLTQRFTVIKCHQILLY